MSGVDTPWGGYTKDASFSGILTPFSSLMSFAMRDNPNKFSPLWGKSPVVVAARMFPQVYHLLDMLGEEEPQQPEGPTLSAEGRVRGFIRGCVHQALESAGQLGDDGLEACVQRLASTQAAMTLVGMRQKKSFVRDPIPHAVGLLGLTTYWRDKEGPYETWWVDSALGTFAALRLASVPAEVRSWWKAEHIFGHEDDKGLDHFAHQGLTYP